MLNGRPLRAIDRAKRAAAVALLMLILPAAAWAAEDGGAEYRLGSGDMVRVTVFGHEDLSGEFQVSGRGNISLPLVGEIQAGERTTSELEDAIVDALRPDYLKNPRVSIEVLNYRPFYIIGEVNEPGGYPYVDGMRVVNAVAIGGGYTYRADEDDILIKRGGAEAAEWQDATPETVVLPGDVIKVPERFF